MRLAHLALIAVFVAGIATVLARTTPDNSALYQLEDRVPNKLPPRPHGLSQLYHYPTDFSRFFDDHFGLRAAAVRWRSELAVWLLRFSPNPDLSFSDVVMPGRDGWRFYIAHGVLRDMEHADPFTPAQLAAWKKTVAERRAWLAARGIKYVLVMPPDKRAIYPEYLPGNWGAPRPGLDRRRQLDQILGNDPAFLDLAPVMRAEKPWGQLYYRWDTHWRHLASWFGYRAAMQRLGLPVEPQTLSGQLRPIRNLGDLGRLVGQHLWEPDTEPVGTCAHPVPQPKAIAALPTTGDEKPPSAFMPSTECAGGTGRLLFFQDSFGDMWAPWLGQQFGRVDYVWRRPSFDQLKRLVEATHPTVVIEERLERFLLRPVPN